MYLKYYLSGIGIDRILAVLVKTGYTQTSCLRNITHKMSLCQLNIAIRTSRNTLFTAVFYQTLCIMSCDNSRNLLWLHLCLCLWLHIYACVYGCVVRLVHCAYVLSSGQIYQIVIHPSFWYAKHECVLMNVYIFISSQALYLMSIVAVTVFIHGLNSRVVSYAMCPQNLHQL